MSQWEQAEAEADMTRKPGIGAIGVVIGLAIIVTILGIIWLILSVMVGQPVVVK